MKKFEKDPGFRLERSNINYTADHAKLSSYIICTLASVIDLFGCGRVIGQKSLLPIKFPDIRHSLCDASFPMFSEEN